MSADLFSAFAASLQQEGRPDALDGDRGLAVEWSSTLDASLSEREDEQVELERNTWDLIHALYSCGQTYCWNWP
jgi:hypothetical protein